MSAHETERLSAYLDGELPIGERAEVSAHLATCQECTSRLSEMAALDERARELPLDAPAGYFDALPGRVRARVEGLAPAGRPGSARRPRRLPKWTWAAAAALILGVVTPLTMRAPGRESAPIPALAVEVPARQPAAAVPETLEGRLVGRADDEAGATEEQEMSPQARARGVAAPPAPVFAPAPASAAPPVALERSEGKADTPAVSVPAQSRPLELELERDTRGFARDTPGAVARTEPLEEKTSADPGAAHQKAAMAADAVASRAMAETTLGGAKASRAQAPAAAAPAGEAGRRELAQANKKAERDEDALSLGALASKNVPSDAAGWRERREEWRAFVAEDPGGSDADEARVRVVETGLQAWRAGGDARDLELAREDAAAYLAREDAAQGPRVQRALESVEGE